MSLRLWFWVFGWAFFCVGMALFALAMRRLYEAKLFKSLERGRLLITVGGVSVVDASARALCLQNQLTHETMLLSVVLQDGRPLQVWWHE
jgi:hypothetical protein